MSRSDSDEASIFRSSGSRWIAGAVCFTVGACLVVAGSTFVVHLVVQRGVGLGSERLRSVLALAAFVAVVAVPVALLVVHDRGDDG